MRVAVNSHALPIHKKNRIASLLCIFETIELLEGQPGKIMFFLDNSLFHAAFSCTYIFIVNT